MSTAPSQFRETWRTPAEVAADPSLRAQARLQRDLCAWLDKKAKRCGESVMFGALTYAMVVSLLSLRDGLDDGPAFVRKVLDGIATRVLDPKTELRPRDADGVLAAAEPEGSA